MRLTSISSELRAIENELRLSSLSDDRTRLLVKQKSALREVVSYIKRGTWTRSSKSVKKLLYILRYGYDSAVVTYECSNNSLYVFMNRQESLIKKAIGSDTLDLIMSGDVERGMEQYSYMTGKINIEAELLPTVIDYLPEGTPNDNYSLSDCENEITLLKRYCRLTLFRLTNNIDRDKMAYITWLIDNKDNSTLDQRIQLYNFLQSE